MPIIANVRIDVVDRTGRIVDQRVGHNVFTNLGRNWLTRLIVAAEFPASQAADLNLTDDGGGTTDSYAVGGKTYRVRYVGVGIGGTLQSITPPGPGGQVEEASVPGIERQVLITATDYLRQIQPADDTADPELFPTQYSVQCKAIFGYDDISFPAQPTYGTNVPVTEIALFTSRAGATVAGGTGSICYHQFSPISKTPDFALVINWDLRA